MARLQTDGQLSIHGRRLMVAEAGNLVSNGKQIHSPCVDATVAVSATATSPRAITITLKDSEGRAIDYAENVEIIVYSTTGMVAFTTTGGSTGLAIGANGALLALVAKKVFKAISDTSGVITLTHTDSGSDACYLGVKLPNGRVIGADRVHTIGV